MASRGYFSPERPVPWPAIVSLTSDEAALVYTREDGGKAIFPLASTIRSVVLGRDQESDLVLDWDPQISRVHAVVERVGSDWTVADDGLSQNGTYVNGERVHGRRRLRDGDRLRLGDVGVVFTVPVGGSAGSTLKVGSEAPAISDAQRRVLVALCRPYRDGALFPTPPANAEIAAELVIGVDTVKAHLKALYERFEVGDLPHQQKRTRLVELAFASGTITPRDLDA
jgi:pSer/pThr/pTyr-binding forkhead associated (FHA) protein